MRNFLVGLFMVRSPDFVSKALGIWLILHADQVYDLHDPVDKILS